MYSTSHTRLGSTQVVLFGEGPSAGRLGSAQVFEHAADLVQLAAAEAAAGAAGVNQAPSTYCPRYNAPKPLRLPLGALNPTTTKSSVRRVRILSHTGDRPARTESQPAWRRSPPASF